MAKRKRIKIWFKIRGIEGVKNVIITLKHIDLILMNWNRNIAIPIQVHNN